FDAFAHACSSHGESSGAFQPPPGSSEVTVTLAPCNGLLLNSLTRCSEHASGFAVGGSRNDNLKVVEGRKTLPAVATDGKPSAPITSRNGRHVRLSTISANCLLIGLVSAAHGKRCHMLLPSTLPASLACC